MHYQSNKELVNYLVQRGVLKTPPLKNAFLSVDRKDFVLPEYRSEIYVDSALPIGAGQTISQPYTVAFMLELLAPQKGERVLDVGSGSGWTTALLAHMVGETGSVYGVEHIPELVAYGKKNLAKYTFPQTSVYQATNVIGLREHAPYDKILVSASAREVPKELTDQLKVGGILVIPIQDAVVKVRKLSKDKTEEETFEGFVFVPLIT